MAGRRRVVRAPASSGLALPGRQRRVAQAVTEPAVLLACAGLCRRLRIRSRADLLASGAIAAPLCPGARRPAVLLPAAVLDRCTMGELRLMLAHELPRVRRRALFRGWVPLAAQ